MITKYVQKGKWAGREVMGCPVGGCPFDVVDSPARMDEHVRVFHPAYLSGTKVQTDFKKKVRTKSKVGVEVEAVAEEEVVPPVVDSGLVEVSSDTLDPDED